MLRQGLRPLLARLRPARAFAAHTMNVPSMGDSITEGTIAGVEKAVGDAVALDEIVAIIDTDKVSVEVRADAAGVIEEIFVAEDDNVEVGAQLLRIETNGAAAPAPAAPAADGFEVTMSGLKFKDEVVGTGESPEKGNVVKVQYTGWLAASDFKFDSSRDRNMPFSFTIGDGNVIPGWDEGVSTMKVGGRRTLLIPPRLAYGDQNIGEGLIPPNSELKFDVELIEVKAGALAGITAGLEGSVGGLLGNFGANPFTFFAVLLVLVTVAPAFLPDDNPLMKGGNPFEGMGN